MALLALPLIDEMIILAAASGCPDTAVFSTKSNPRLATFFRKCAKTCGFVEKSPEVWEALPLGNVLPALYLCRSALEVLGDSFPSFKSFPLEKQMDLYSKVRLWPAARFVKFAKYFTAYPMAKFLKNPPPEEPEGWKGHPLVWGGPVLRLLKSRLNAVTKVNARLWIGMILGVKRAAREVPDSFVQDAMLKHAKTLQTLPSEEEKAGAKELGRYAIRILLDFKAPRPKLFEGSSSASFESARSKGGARSELIRTFHGDDRDVLGGRESSELLGMVDLRRGKVGEIKGFSLPPLDEVVDRAYEAVVGEHKHHFFGTVPRPAPVMMAAITEPLKVRLVSKGLTLPYYVSRFYQKGLFKHLKTFPQFVLTTRPLDVQDLHWILDTEQKLGNRLGNPALYDNVEWVSGDYSAATDWINSDLTMEVFNTSLMGSDYGVKLKTVLRSVIGPQEINYPSENRKQAAGRLDPFVQETGQLMGSTLSFPILCMINLICYWSALEEVLGRPLNPRELPVLINGDDILFRANKYLYRVWQEHIAKAGFRLSMGKNYRHPKIFTINSEYFWFTKGEKVSVGESISSSSTFTPLLYLNPGLLMGQTRKTGRQAARILPIWDVYNECIPGAINQPRAHRRFVHYWKREIVALTMNGQYNLFLPFDKGGLGFNLPEGVPLQVTPFQRRFATFLVKSRNEAIKAGRMPSRTSLGLVAARDPLTAQVLKRHILPTSTFIPVVGPLLPFQTREFTDPTVKRPSLSSHLPTEAPVLSMRFPKGSAIREFRAARPPMMTKKRLLEPSFGYGELLSVREQKKFEEAVDTRLLSLQAEEEYKEKERVWLSQAGAREFAARQRQLVLFIRDHPHAVASADDWAFYDSDDEAYAHRAYAE